MQKEYTSYREFWPFYLSQHMNPICRVLHFIGTLITLGILVAAIVTAKPKLLWLMPVAGYSFAWVGHFFFEKNRPATFRYPLWSLIGDYHMFFSICFGKLPIAPQQVAIKNDSPVEGRSPSVRAAK